VRPRAALHRERSAGAGTIYLGGQFHSVGGLLQPGIAAIAVDVPTATLLAQFQAAATADGIELRWRFSEPNRVSIVAVERASDAAGPWESITPERWLESGATVALDRTADRSGDYFHRLAVRFTDGGQAVFGPVSASRGELLTRGGLALVFPNPTPGRIQVQYGITRAGQVRLELVDVSGRVVATLADRTLEPGRYAAAWDGAGRRGRIAPGLYFVRLTAPDQKAVRKLAIVR